MNLSLNERQFILEAIDQQMRVDGRGILECRPISVNYGVKFGQVEVSLGNTKVFGCVSSHITEPEAHTPEEGFLFFNIDVSPHITFTQTESKNTKLEGFIELRKIIQKLMKDSKCLDVKSLCILKGKKVWSVKCNLTILNNDGNVIDCACLAALLSLMHYRKNSVRVSGDQVEEITTDLKPLSITHMPINCTFAFFNGGSTLVIDPTEREEQVMEGRISVALNIYKQICGIHKLGGTPLSAENIKTCIRIAADRIGTVTKMLRANLQQQGNQLTIDKNSFAIDAVEELGEHSANSLGHELTSVIKTDEFMENMKSFVANEGEATEKKSRKAKKPKKEESDSEEEETMVLQ